MKETNHNGDSKMKEAAEQHNVFENPFAGVMFPKSETVQNSTSDTCPMWAFHEEKCVRCENCPMKKSSQ